jgi:hypothetical protein
MPAVGPSDNSYGSTRAWETWGALLVLNDANGASSATALPQGHADTARQNASFFDGENMDSFMVALAVALWGLGIAGIVFVKRRAFYRRNMAGVEEFRGYGNMIVTRLFETSVNVAALFCIIAGAAVMFKAGR